MHTLQKQSRTIQPQTFAEVFKFFKFNIFRKTVQYIVVVFLTAAPNGGDLQNMFSKMGP